MKIYKIVACLMLLAFVGCVSLPIVGDKPDAVPPKIVLGSDNSKVWDRPGAFGPVPAELQETGSKVCAPLGMKAIGYHPYAQDEKGNAFPGGGYFCVLDK